MSSNVSPKDDWIKSQPTKVAVQSLPASATQTSYASTDFRRPASDTPIMSYISSPKDAAVNEGDSSSSSRTSPRVLNNSGSNSSTNIPPLLLSQRRATTLDVPGLTKSKVSPDGRIAARDIESKLVIVMVGLPARGKSYVTKKLARYLNWQLHETKIFNVGNTRRKANQKVGPASCPLPDHTDEANEQAIAEEMAGAPPDQSADFFSPNNVQTSQLREQWAMDTLEELLDFVLIGNGSVGILDATNTTVARRKKVLARIKERSGGRLKVLFLESICTRSEIIESNVRLKLSGPDYKDMDSQVALQDFLERLRNYERVYETIGPEEEANDDIQYIKMINVGKKVVCYNIQGFLAGQAVFFLLNFNLAERQIWITRHGESEDNATGRIGGDAKLTPRGVKFSQALARFMTFKKAEFRKRELEQFKERVSILEKKGSQPTTPLSEPEEPNFCVWTSSLRRSIETSAPFDEENFDIKEMRMLNELGAGICDSMTYKEIQKKYPEEYAARIADKIHYRYPGIGGESYLDVINRLRPVIVEMERMEDNALVITHRVVARVLLAYFMNLGQESIGDLDVPLHTLYVLEPKPYGVDWALYEYNEETDWFYRVPKETIKEKNRRRSNSEEKVGSNYFTTKDRQFSVIPSSFPENERLEFRKTSRTNRRRPSSIDELPVRQMSDSDEKFQPAVTTVHGVSEKLSKIAMK